MTILNADKNAEKLDHSYTAGRIEYGTTTLENNLTISYKTKCSTITVWGIHPIETKTYSHTETYTQILVAEVFFFGNSKKLESSQMPFNR